MGDQSNKPVQTVQPIGTVSEATATALHKLTGHQFTNYTRLDRALTHSSARNRTGKDYERLEFLGDRVLGLCVAEMLFSQFDAADEGELSVRLNALVNADTLAEIADELGLAEFIRVGSDVSDRNSSRQKNMRADVLEALIATIYLDAGLEAARGFIFRYWAGRAAVIEARRDAKTELQEWAHRQYRIGPSYMVIARDGPDHEPLFTVKVSIGEHLSAIAEGASKRLAEQAAATTILISQGIWQTDEQA